MKITGSIPRKRRLPSLKNAVMVDTCRGVLRVRKWPKKRGTPKSALQRWWIDWFRQANLLAKYADGMTQARAIEMTKGSGLYPRDVMLKAMRGRLYVWADSTGWKWYPVAAIQDISDTLDVLAQTVGSVLVRAADRWRAPPAGAFDDVLTHKGAANPPVWQAPAAGGGVTQQVLPGSPVVCDNTVSQYDFDVSDYAMLNVDFDDVVFAASSRPVLRFSIDGGATFKAGATDYETGYVTASVDGWIAQGSAYTSGADATSGHNGHCHFTNLRAGRCAWSIGASRTAAEMVLRVGFFKFDGPVTDIRVLSRAGSNFKTGTIRLVGIK